METLYIYVRVSTNSQFEKGYSIPQQISIGKAKAKELGMTHMLFVEEGKSASGEDFTNRPELIKLLALVEEGKAKHIFVFDQTRLSRHNITKAIISDKLKKNKVTLYTNQNEYNLNKSEDEFTLKILEAIESYESALRKARFNLGRVSANSKGKSLHNIPPFGYTKDSKGYFIIDNEEKDIYLKIVELYLKKGYGTTQIADFLNRNNIPTKTSKILKNGYTLRNGIHNRKKSRHISTSNWNPGTVLSILKNPIYIGERKYKVSQDEYNTIPCEPLISKEIYDQIQAKRQNNAINKKRLDKYFYLLKSILQCGNCGNSLHGRIKPNRGEKTYKCNSKRVKSCECNSRGINIDSLNSIVWNCFKASIFYFNAITRMNMPSGRSASDITLDIETLQFKLDELSVEKSKIENQQAKLLLYSASEGLSKKAFEDASKELTASFAIAQGKIESIIRQIDELKRIVLKADIKAKSESEMYQEFHAKQLELDEFFPFENSETQSKARNLINEAILRVIVSYIPSTRIHEIIVFYRPVEMYDNITEETLTWEFEPKVFRIKIDGNFKSENLSESTIEFLKNLNWEVTTCELNELAAENVIFDEPPFTPTPHR